jgi:hypothetical protein
MVGKLPEGLQEPDKYETAIKDAYANKELFEEWKDMDAGALKAAVDQYLNEVSPVLNKLPPEDQKSDKYKTAIIIAYQPGPNSGDNKVLFAKWQKIEDSADLKAAVNQDLKVEKVPETKKNAVTETSLEVPKGYRDLSRDEIMNERPNTVFELPFQAGLPGFPGTKF